MSPYAPWAALVAGVALAGVVGCGSALPTASQFDADRVDSTVVRLAEGRDTYVAKCSGCHVLFTPDTRTAKTWRTEVAEMRDRVRLSDGEEQLIVEYLAAFSRPATGG